MKQRGHSLQLATSAFRGILPAASEWPIVLDIANRGWLTPALYVALERSARLQEVPEEVRNYLALLHDHNVERNRRMRSQLIEALRAFNAIGVEPILLKGGIKLFAGDDVPLRSRMITDLDIDVAPSDLPRIMTALSALGYRETRHSKNAYELARMTDVGVMELHHRPNVRSARYLTGDLERAVTRVEREGVTAKIPSPTAQAIHLIVHDMIKEGNYWRFRTNLRHLHDLALLAESDEGIDWSTVATSLSDSSGRGALAMELNALRDLFGTKVPAALCDGALRKMRHAARLQAGEKGAAGTLTRLVGRLMWGYRKFRDSYGTRGTQDLIVRMRKALFSPPKGSTI